MGAYINSDFKETEVGLIPVEWDVLRFDEVATLQRGKDLPSHERRLGQYPVIGSNGIVGYHDEFVSEGPGVTVGRSGSVGQLFFIEGRFWPLNTSLWIKDFHGHDELFIYYLLCAFDFERYATGVSVPTLNRNYVHQAKLAVPPLPEQRRIAAVLNAIQQDIAAQEDIIAEARAFKRSLMQRLFTYGPGPVPAETKETEIGEIPAHWDLCQCEDLCKKISVGIVVKPASYYVSLGIPAFRSLNIQEDRLVLTDLVYISPEDNGTVLSKSKLQTDDVLIVRTGYPGTSCVVPQEFDGSNCIDLVFARPDNTSVTSQYLSRYFNSEMAKRQVLAAKTGLAQQHLNVSAVKRTLVPLPSLGEQEGIGALLEDADKKIAVEEDRRAALQGVFTSTLHQLMTGQIRLLSDEGMPL